MSKQQNRLEEQTRSTQELRRELENKEREIAMSCSHSKPNRKGELRFTLQALHNGQYRCDQCGTKFSLSPVNHKELIAAVDTVHNALQQVRSFSDPYNDEAFIRELGRTDYNIQNLDTYYGRALQSYSGNNGRGGKPKSQNGFSAPY